MMYPYKLAVREAHSYLEARTINQQTKSSCRVACPLH